MEIGSVSGVNPVDNQNNVKTAPQENSSSGVNGASSYSSTETIGTLDSLKRLDPQGYDAMLKSIANDINEESKKSNDRLKEIRKEYERQ
ncbi:MAG: hypothetical protein ACH350_00245 [Parachlamydiaceae bacterium]